jgi:hypothetical protein
MVSAAHFAIHIKNRAKLSVLTRQQTHPGRLRRVVSSVGVLLRQRSAQPGVMPFMQDSDYPVVAGRKELLEQ